MKMDDVDVAMGNTGLPDIAPLVFWATEKRGETGVPGCSRVAIPWEEGFALVVEEEEGEETLASFWRPLEFTMT